ncbi:acyl transferase/acyl hydrolase/lysophospholipase [Boletus reticuloceps]|uniref:Acyl transferase/acyl hydrolase/lysophospholipase n=1 Tax=Boletus reticuloceps TaxID=495285 RepID=A0A8I2YJV3_9AGAM|nr:acyl transferase/acyl hydrolase/lysophospholipase [Boletus reticuloceps]
MRMLVDDPDEEPVPPPCQVFDLICGTSTGGIIAILLGRLGLDCSTAISVYKELGPRVFGMDEGKMWSQIAAGEKFSSIAFETFLAEVVKTYTDGPNTPMKILKSERDAKCQTTDVFVTTISAETGSAGAEPYRLRSYATPRGGTTCILPDNTPWTIREAARATSATPMYFAPLEIGSQAFQDAAASGFNNPTLEVLAEAALRWSREEPEFVVISLGTGLTSLLRNSNRKGRERLGNAAIAEENVEQIWTQLVAVANDTENTHLEVARRCAKWGRPDDYFRFNPPQGLGDLDLADYMSEGTIIEITNVWLRTPDGKDSTLAAYEKLLPAYEARKDSREQ